MKFTVNAKKLKTMMEKSLTAIDKKSFPEIMRLYFSVEKGSLKVLGTNLEHWLEVTSDEVYNVESGAFGIDIDDIKILSKMNGEITLEDVPTKNKLNIKFGRKIVSIPCHENNQTLPTMDKTETKIMAAKENWLLETITNLSIYTSNDKIKPLTQVFYFNMGKGRIEAVDGHRIGMRSIENQTIYEKAKSIKLHNRCVPVFKKALDKKSENELTFYSDEKFLKVQGADFTYIIRNVEGDFFKVESMLDMEEGFSFTPYRKEFFDIMSYNNELTKSEEIPRPVILHSENGRLYSYLHTTKYETFDEIGTTKNNMKDDFYMGFNPKFLMDAFNIVDSDSPKCIGYGSTFPLIIEGDEYKILVLPVVINRYTSTELKQIFSGYINKQKA